MRYVWLYSGYAQIRLDMLLRPSTGSSEAVVSLCFRVHSTHTMDQNDAVIVAAVRTPLCRSRKGGLANVPPSTLMEIVMAELLQQSKIPPSDIEDVCIGNVLLPASGFAAIRMAQFAAGFPDTVSLQMVNRQCASGLQAIANIAQSVKAGTIRIGLAGGVESMSTTPMTSIQPPTVDWDRLQTIHSAMDCLLPMGITSETVAKEYGLQRHELDAFAAASHQKAAAAQEKFRAEIVPVQGVTMDDGVRQQTTAAVLSKLKPAFTPTGSTTAGNSSQTTDGAAGVIMMSRREANRRGLPVLAVWRGFATVGVPPRVMGIGPAVAIPKVLEQVGLRKEDVDVYEINEAFASQAVWCIRTLGLDVNKVNPNGGAIALGHPLGCTGARLVVSLVHELRRRKRRYGVVSMCVGTGMGAAAVIEVEPVSGL